MNITFKTIDKNDILFLYELFAERIKYPKSIRFEEKDIPTLKDHTKFVMRFIKSKDHNYKRWHIILLGKEKVGAIVLKKDGEWGYHVLMKYWGKDIGQAALDWLIKQNQNDTLIARIKPENLIARHIAEKFGHKLKELTYIREPKTNNL